MPNNSDTNIIRLTHPLSRQRVCPSLRNQRAHSPTGEGLGESQCRRLEKKRNLCLLCGWREEAENEGRLYLAGSMEPFADDEVDDAPGDEEGGEQVPLEPHQVGDTLRDPQDTVTK